MNLVWHSGSQGTRKSTARSPEAFEHCAFGDSARESIMRLHKGELLLKWTSVRSICPG